MLKKEPLDRFAKESGLFPIKGITASESKQRKGDWIEHGCNILQGEKHQSRPLSLFTNDDVWEYVRRFNIPYCSLYDPIVDENKNIVVPAETRTGCAFCAYGLDQDRSEMNKV